MAYFEWAQDMVIDHGPIDEDHKKLVDLVNALHDATSQGRGREVVGRLLGTLIHDTADHLHKEESVMAAAGYPQLERHKVGHQEFVNSLNDLQRKYQAGSITVASQLSAVLRDWLSLHIRRYDKDLHHFLRQQQRGQAKARR